MYSEYIISELELFHEQAYLFLSFFIYLFIYGKRHKSVYRLVTAPQGGTQKYTLTFAYDSPRWLVK